MITTYLMDSTGQKIEVVPEGLESDGVSGYAFTVLTSNGDIDIYLQKTELGLTSNWTYDIDGGALEVKRIVNDENTQFFKVYSSSGWSQIWGSEIAAAALGMEI